MISCKAMTKILYGNPEKVLSNGKKWLQQTSSGKKFFMFVLLISNHTVFAFNLKLICTCEVFKKLILHSPKRLVQFQEKLVRANWTRKTVWLPKQTTIKLYTKTAKQAIWMNQKPILVCSTKWEINNQPQFFTVLSHSLATTFWVGNFGSIIFEGRRTVNWDQFSFWHNMSAKAMWSSHFHEHLP